MMPVKVLLDHDVPHPLRHHFPDGYDVYTAYFMGWADVIDADLLRIARAAGFSVLVTSVLVTIDKGIGFQQNLASSPLGIIFLRIHPAKLPTLLPLMPALEEALPAAAEGRHLTIFRCYVLTR